MDGQDSICYDIGSLLGLLELSTEAAGDPFFHRQLVNWTTYRALHARLKPVALRVAAGGV